jgi:hypothetical protein
MHSLFVYDVEVVVSFVLIVLSNAPGRGLEGGAAPHSRHIVPRARQLVKGKVMVKLKVKGKLHVEGKYIC